jgi:hypothetical protein
MVVDEFIAGVRERPQFANGENILAKEVKRAIHVIASSFPGGGSDHPIPTRVGNAAIKPPYQIFHFTNVRGRNPREQIVYRVLAASQATRKPPQPRLGSPGAPPKRKAARQHLASSFQWPP